MVENTDVKQIYDIMYIQLPVKTSLYLFYNLKTRFLMFWLRGEECEKLNLFGCVNFTPPRPIILHGIHQNWTHCSICKRTGHFDISYIENVVLCVFYVFITKKFEKKTFFIVLCVFQIEQCTYLSLFDPLYSAVFSHLLIE